MGAETHEAPGTHEEPGSKLFGYEFAHLETPQTYASAVVLIFISGLLAVILVARYMIGTKWNQTFARLHVPESGVTMLIGIILGAFIHLGTKSKDGQLDNFNFSPTIFWVGLLPPILFNEAYHLQRQFFYSYLGVGMLFAIAGTVLSTAVISGLLWTAISSGLVNVPLDFPECVTFSTLISATDTVAVLAVFAELRVGPKLFYLVFCESVLNDAVALTMYEIASKFVTGDPDLVNIGVGVGVFCLVFVGSLLVGYIFGCLVALILKYADLKDHPILELSVYGVQVYLPFLFAQVIGLSGICTSLAAGITLKHYAHQNLSSAKVKEFADFAFRLLAFLADNAVFMYLGMSIFGLNKFVAHLDWLFLLWTFLVCLISRAVAIFGVASVINLIAPFTSAEHVDFKNQVVMWFSGLRGAVALAAAINFPTDAKHQNRDLILSTTMGIIIIFSIVLAPFTVPLLKLLKVPCHVDHGEAVAPKASPVVRYFTRLTRKYVAPILLIRCKRCGALSCLKQHTPRHMRPSRLCADEDSLCHDTRHGIMHENGVPVVSLKESPDGLPAWGNKWARRDAKRKPSIGVQGFDGIVASMAPSAAVGARSPSPARSRPSRSSDVTLSPLHEEGGSRRRSARQFALTEEQPEPAHLTVPAGQGQQQGPTARLSLPLQDRLLRPLSHWSTHALVENRRARIARDSNAVLRHSTEHPSMDNSQAGGRPPVRGDRARRHFVDEFGNEWVRRRSGTLDASDAVYDFGYAMLSESQIQNSESFDTDASWAGEPQQRHIAHTDSDAPTLDLSSDSPANDMSDIA